jgi:hypothetical protein
LPQCLIGIEACAAAEFFEEADEARNVVRGRAVSRTLRFNWRRTTTWPAASTPWT